MCGLAGFWDYRARLADPQECLDRMTDALVHRGPDARGTWRDEAAGVGIGHRRLSIIDLSEEGRQPMASACGRYQLAFNGEIYNYRGLRAELESAGCSFRGTSDTEVLLAAVATWGLTRAIAASIGMFAIALWDRGDRRLHLLRDRVGIKPLYYGEVDGSLVFGSELKALRRHPSWTGEIDRGALALYLRHNYIPAPYSIHTGIRKIRPGHIVSFEVRDGRLEERDETYWRVADHVGGDARLTDPLESAERLDQLLRDAVGCRMVADVPLGAFLSGGIDSSVVVALMQAQAADPVRTFSIGFAEAEYDESVYARRVAEHLGTRHTELVTTPADALAVIPRLPELFDEPFSDSSQIPTYLVSHLARQSVTVSLSGDGGDELFCGYTRYAWGESLHRTAGRVPRFARPGLARLVEVLPVEAWDGLLAPARAVAPAATARRLTGDVAHKLAAIMKCDSFPAMYHRLVSHWKEPGEVVRGGLEPPTVFTDPAQACPGNSFLDLMMYVDQLSYLPDDILAKVDRASMGVSLEARVPLLDHRVIEFAWSLDNGLKRRDGTGKWLLRNVLARYVPRGMFERPKKGFGIPLAEWLRGPLREWGEELLAPQRLAAEGFFDPEPIRIRWQEHQSGRRRWHYYLWDILVFQAWLERTRA